MDPLSIIASTIAIIEATSATYKTIQHLKNLPKEFDEVKQYLPLVKNTLHLAQGRLTDGGLSRESTEAIVPILNDCENTAQKLDNIFEKVAAKEDGTVYRTSLLRFGNLGKARRVEALMQKLVKSVQAVALNDAFRASTESQVAVLQEAIDKLALVKSSVSDSDFASGEQNVQYISDTATGYQANNYGDGVQQFNGGYNFAPSRGGIQNFVNLVLNNNHMRTSETQPEDFSVPFSIRASERVETFIGRDEEVALIHDKLQGQNARRVVAIHGLGGMGKTQLSLKYVMRYKTAYSAIFWLNSSDRQSIQQSFVEVAEQIHQAHPSVCKLGAKEKEEHPELAVKAVRAWLSHAKNTQWLLVCDNYDNPKVKDNKDPAALDICDFLPEADHGSVLITTRVVRAGIGHHIPIRRMDDVESLKVLSMTSRRAGVLDNADAKELVKILDGLPLALASAGSYLQQLVQTTFKEYLDLYNNKWAELQGSNHDLETYDHTLYTTWQLSYEHVQKQNVLSANLLRWWAYFDNHDVWFELLRGSNKYTSIQPSWMQQLTASMGVFNEAVRVLVIHGLVEKDNTPAPQYPTASGGYRIHACVHAWTIHVLNAEFDRVLAALSFVCVAYYLEGDPYKSKPSRFRLARHAARCISFPSTFGDDLLRHGLLSLVIILEANDDLQLAESRVQQVLCELEKTLGPNNKVTLDVKGNLAKVYEKQGKLEEAEKISLQVLSSIETTAGPDHDSTLNAAYRAGYLHMKLGKNVAAEKLLRRALSGFEKTYGPAHVKTLGCTGMLGELFFRQGKWGEAENMYSRCLSGSDVLSGAEAKVQAFLGLGNIYYDQKKYDEAETMFTTSLSIFEGMIGPEIQATLVPVGQLANTYIMLGNFGMAEKMLRRVIPGLETLAGRERRMAVQLVGLLGKLYTDQGRHDEAREIYSLIPEYVRPAQMPSDTFTGLLTRLKQFFS